MTATAERLRSERDFHDRQAEERARALGPNELRFRSADYLGHESWVESAFAALGDVRGRRTLDLGCGHGMAAVVLARRGARVTACDLSPGYLREVQARAAANGVALDLVSCAGEALPFADASFDLIWGHAVLHHLDLGQAAGQLRRVLAPGGRAVFCEPWGENRCLAWARRLLPYPGKHRTADEAPLRLPDLTRLRRVFPRVAVTGHQLTAMAARLLPSKPLRRGLHRLDEQIIFRFPHLQRYCRYVVLVIQI